MKQWTSFKNLCSTKDTTKKYTGNREKTFATCIADKGLYPVYTDNSYHSIIKKINILIIKEQKLDALEDRGTANKKAHESTIHHPYQWNAK